jgi:branched-subunit amino acid ABC-type transport system permease component
MKQSVALMVIVLVLIARPSGLFGKARASRV